jgi:8-oxo-dGTP pyrophosphatase MutT (NUDIX family)
MIYLKTYEQYGSGNYAEFDNNNNEPFWGNIAAGVLPYSKTTKKFLLNYRSEYVNEPHTWGIWGGKLDDDENIKDTVIREFEEESGFNNNIELIDAYIFKNPTGDFKYYNFIGLIENEFEPILDWESEDYKWVTIDELYNQDNLHFGLEKLLKESKNIIINL